MISVDLDIAYDWEFETLQGVLRGIEDAFTVTAETLRVAGPGGGWPLVRFTGGQQSVSNLVEWYRRGQGELPV